MTKKLLTYSLSLAALALGACHSDTKTSPSPQDLNQQTTEAPKDSTQTDLQGTANTGPVIPSEPVLPGDGITEEEKKDESLDAYQQRTLQSRSKAEVVLSSSPADYGAEYWVGDGVDALTGKRVPTCFDEQQRSVRAQDLNQVSSNFDLVTDRQDMQKKLQKGLGFDLSGVWQLFTLGLSLKRKIVQETNISEQGVYGLSSFSYLKESRELYQAWPNLASPYQKALEKSPYVFRRYCGDRYVNKAAIGANMYLVFQAQLKEGQNLNGKESSNALKLGWASILGINIGSDLSKEQKNILAQYRLEMKCYTEGVSIDVCGEFGLNTSFDILKDREQLANKINNARQKLIAEAKSGEKLVVVQEEQQDYMVPEVLCTKTEGDPCPSKQSVFFDYNNNLSRVIKLGQESQDYSQLCSQVTDWPKRCQQVQFEIEQSARQCMDTALACGSVDSDQKQILRAAKDPGFIDLFRDAQFGGEKSTLTFSSWLNEGRLAASSFKSLRDLGLSRMDNRVSSLSVHLNPGWRVRFFDDKSSNNRGSYFDLEGQRDILWINDAFADMNDRVSALELFRAGDMP